MTWRLDRARLEAVRTYELTRQIPPFFRVIALGRVQGLQTIHRAELSALVLLTETFSRFVVYSDSANALRDVESCGSDAYMFERLRHEHPDLLDRIHAALQPGQTFRKVKAHQLETPDLQGMEKYHALGNHVADLAAARLLSVVPCNGGYV